MKYDWEQVIGQDVLDEVQAILQRHGLDLIGLGARNAETEEGAFICRVLENATPIDRADVLQDVAGDVSEEYSRALTA